MSLKYFKNLKKRYCNVFRIRVLKGLTSFVRTVVTNKPEIVIDIDREKRSAKASVAAGRIGSAYGIIWP